MGTLVQLKNLIAKHRKDEKGSMATTFAISAMTLIMATGTAFDVSVAQSSSSRIQQVADIVGLTATVYVKNHGKPPTSDDEGFVHNRTYSAKELGYKIGYATSGGNDVKFRVMYNEAKGEAKVYMAGKIQTSFMGMVGHKYIQFGRESTIKYAATEAKEPASIFLVLDNSGSMAWDGVRKSGRNGTRPPGAVARMTTLKVEVTNFNNYLATEIQAKTHGQLNDYLRMGLTGYASGVINNLTVTPRWGTLPPTAVTNLRASGGTDPRNSMELVEDWMAGEDQEHEDRNGNKEPLKYVIFMTDGVNNSSYATTQTLATCSRLRSKGIQVYTIGFALEPGWYAYNASNYGGYNMTTGNSATAYSFLQSCASSSQHFIKAENSAALRAAFDSIGEDIVEDVIRVTS